jgi:hypothetical protein
LSRVGGIEATFAAQLANQRGPELRVHRSNSLGAENRGRTPIMRRHGARTGD